jgi:NitT/TauT family transport system ATP-binding protein
MIKLNHINFSYSNHTVFEDFNLNFEANKIHVIMGHSGCGKTTLLHLLASLLKPQHGTIEGIDNKHVSYIFQEPRLLPWRTVFENIKLSLNHLDKEAEKTQLANEIIQKVGLSRFASYYPNQLSGGMQQRVSMARAFAFPSQLILLDEPFQNLDIKLKDEMIALFQCLWEFEKRTVVCVTHDIDEAIMLAHSIYLFPTLAFQNKTTYYTVNKDDASSNAILKQNINKQLRM